MNVWTREEALDDETLVVTEVRFPAVHEDVRVRLVGPGDVIVERELVERLLREAGYIPSDDRVE